MNNWQRWAKAALDEMDRRGMTFTEERQSLQQVVEQGYEPYYTLKAFAVLQLGLSDGE
jgi:hypothetical protein